MTEKRYYLEDFKDFTVITLRLYDRKIKHKHYDWLTESHKIVDLLNKIVDENEQLKDALNQRTDQCDNYYKENEQLKSELAEIKRQEQEVIEYLQAYHKGDVKELKE